MHPNSVAKIWRNVRRRRNMAVGGRNW
jgi:hypothetical protein